MVIHQFHPRPNLNYILSRSFSANQFNFATSNFPFFYNCMPFSSTSSTCLIILRFIYVPRIFSDHLLLGLLIINFPGIDTTSQLRFNGSTAKCRLSQLSSVRNSVTILTSINSINILYMLSMLCLLMVAVFPETYPR